MGALCAVCMMVTMITPAFASAITAQSYAYMSTAGASPELRQRILEARRDIIYAPEQGWSLDGTFEVVSADGTVEKLPKFSDVFPGWSLYEICALNPTTAIRSNGVSPQAAGDVLFENSVNLKITTTATPFYSFNSLGQYIEVIADTIPGTKYSAAIKNEDTGVDLAYKGNMLLGNSVKGQTVSNVRYSCRASSVDKAGDAYMIVREASK